MARPTFHLVIHHRIREWLYRHRQAIIVTAGSVCLAVIAAQLAYPAGRAVPLARLDGQPVGWATTAQLTVKLRGYFAGSQVRLTAGTRSATVALGSLGASNDTAALTQQLVEYPWWQRLLPFSFVFKQPSIRHLSVYFVSSRLQEAADDLAAKLSSPATNARLNLKGDQIVTVAAKPGYRVSADKLAQLLSSADFGLHTTNLAAPATKLVPARTNADVAALYRQAEAAAGRLITISGPRNTHFQPSRATIISWLTVDDQNGKAQLAVDPTAVERYVAGLNDKVKTDSGVTTVTTVDGQTTATKPGAVGQAVVEPPLVDALTQAVLDASAPHQLTIQMMPVQPAVAYDRHYTSSLAGLRAYVTDAANLYNAHIAVAQLDGAGWTASARAGDSIPSASTYKLFVSYMLADQINKGKIHWTDSMLDTTVSGCFERMIVLSDNPCAEKFIAIFGAHNLDNFLHSRGISQGTTFEASDATHTTAADLMILLRGIQDGSRIGGSTRASLLDKMGRQVYRQGIPAGSAGTVQDKVGFLWDYLHDAAIVHHPRGTYALVIMTKGQSWGRIADITREIERIMYP